MTDEDLASKWLQSQPHCCSYPDCNGDLEGIPHSERCPLYGQEALTLVELLAAYARQQREQDARLAESSVCMDCDCPHKHSIALAIRNA